MNLGELGCDGGCCGPQPMMAQHAAGCACITCDTTAREEIICPTVVNVVFAVSRLSSIMLAIYIERNNIMPLERLIGYLAGCTTQSAFVVTVS